MTISVGSLEVVALLDASGPFPVGRDEAFPDATGEHWERARRLDPGAFGGDRTWNLDFRCYAILDPRGGITLVDTGVGPEGSPASEWAPGPGHLPDELRTAGVKPTAVDVVVLTHLHEDHRGWSVHLAGVPVFPNARYVVQHDEVAALSDEDTAMRHVVAPLRDAGQLQEVDGEVLLTDSRDRLDQTITVLPTPGHTPGHQSVLVTGGGSRSWSPVMSEADQELARRSRTELLARAGQERGLLATAHLTRPFVPACRGWRCAGRADGRPSSKCPLHGGAQAGVQVSGPGPVGAHLDDAHPMGGAE
ncbi:MAG: MBL fold metallo-hydrolase, partial [Actinomycetes bacterium]